MFPVARNTLQDLPPVAHGALDFAELEQLGLRPDQVIDFSSNTNAYGPPPGVLAALRRAIGGPSLGGPSLGRPGLDHYPDREALALRRALARRLDAADEQVLVGSGAAELIQLAALAYLEPGQRALILGPTFGEYARVARLVGAQVDELRAAEADGFRPDLAAIARQLSGRRYRLVFLCTPNNPTGWAIAAPTLAEWSAAHGQTLFVIDEAYLPFGDCLPSLAGGRQPPNLLILRSMTKDYALAGLRLGYAVGHPAVIAALRQAQPPWSVNSLAQVAGLAALAGPAQAHLQASLARLRAAAASLQGGLRRLGLETLGGGVHFFLLRCPPQFASGAALRAALRGRGLLVRDCASFDLPGYVRIAARRPAENRRLLAAIQELMTQ